MHEAHIDVFDYDLEIKILPEEWMKDMAIVFHEFDEDSDGVIPGGIAHHIMSLFRLPSKGLFQEPTVKLAPFLEVAGLVRSMIFSSPKRRAIYYFQMIAGYGRNSIDAVDIQRFISVAGDDIPLKFCDDFIDEFDRLKLSKDSLTIEEFCSFVIHKKIPV
jgi:Ca2+-binding EF-hand superfamily protein